MRLYRCLPLGIEQPQRIASLLVAWIPGVEWVILFVLGWHLASFQAWKPAKHQEMMMFHSCLWQASAPSQPAKLLVQDRVQGEDEAKVPSILAYRSNFGHLNYESGSRDRLTLRHSQSNEGAHEPRTTV
jgi:hypothetical protein